MPKQRILPHIILGVISACDTRVTGKQITDYVYREIGEFWQVAHSQVYPELKRMVEEGLLECHAVPHNDKEKHYSITPAGKLELEEWLAIPNDETPQHKDIFSLKMFFIRTMDDGRIVGLLEGQIELLDKHLQHLMKNNSIFRPNFYRNELRTLFGIRKSNRQKPSSARLAEDNISTAKRLIQSIFFCW